ncbi:MAG: InlB B-repeat-containing protein [Ruminococcus sp.]|nr:InlB B-repeat-containing protein [Ruminococcus sp.]
MKNKIGIKILSLLLAGTMAVGTVGASVSFDTAIVAEASDEGTAIKIITDNMRALTPFCPVMNIAGSFIGSLWTLFEQDNSGAVLNEINQNISDLRREMEEQYTALNNKLDDNTRQILNTLGNKITINSNGQKLNELTTAVNMIADQIDVTVKGKKTAEEKTIAIAKHIRDNQSWSQNSNLIYEVELVGRLLSGKSFAELDGKDIYTAAYTDCCQNVMFSGEAYDLAENYIVRIMEEYYCAYSVAMQCLKAVKDAASFTDEQINGLSQQARKDYLDLSADAEQAEFEMQKLTKQLFDLDDPDSVGYHYLAFVYRRLKERNIFVRYGKEVAPFPVEITETAIKADVSGDSNTYYYDDYKKDVTNVVNKIKKAVTNGIEQSDISSEKICELYNYVNANYPNKSFDDYLEYVGISTDSFRKRSNTFFPVSESIDEGRALKHYTREEPELKGNTDAKWDVIGESDWSMYWNVGIKSFQHSKAGSGTENYWFYKVKNWYVGWFLDSNYGYRPEKQNNNMLVFQKTDPIKVPANGSDIVEQLRSEGVYDYTLKWTAASTQRYSLGKRAFSKNRISVYDYFGNPVDVETVLEAQETPEQGIDISGSNRTRMVINTTKPGTYHLRFKAENAFGDTFYSQWINWYAFDADGRITADASGWPKKVVLGVYDLDKLIKVSILNTKGQSVNDKYTFEAKEPCIKINGSQMTVHDFGTFHIRAKTVNANGKEIYSDWVTFESLSGAPSGFNVLSYLMYYEGAGEGRKEITANVRTDLDPLFKLKVVYEAGSWVLSDPFKAIWELKELPEKGCCISDGKYFFASQPGVYHVRAVNYDYNIVTEWYTVNVVSYGADDSEFWDIDFEYDSSYDAPDENTSFVIRQSYTGLVGAEPDSIEQPSMVEMPKDEKDDTAKYPAHKRLMVDVIDGISGREIRVKYSWEAQETDGISLAEDGTVTFTKAGTYHVRVSSGEYSSDWFEISAAAESKEYATVAFCDEDGRTITAVTLPWGAKLTPPADPVKDGYTFAGWSQEIPERMPADDLSIYAVWTKNGEPASESRPDDTKPAGNGGGSNPGTGAAAGMLASAAAALGTMTVIKKKKS